MLPALGRGNGGGVGTHPLAEFRRQMADLFERFLGRPLLPTDGESADVRAWDFGVADQENEVVVRAEVPGFEADEIDVQLADAALTIRAEKKQKNDGEQSYRAYRRTVTLPCGVKEDKATATCRNGVLELHVPKTEASKARRIAVQAK